MTSNQTTPTFTSTVANWLKTTPVYTRNVILVCFILYIYQLIFNNQTPPSLFIFQPYAIIEFGQVWRLITGAFFHGSFFHILFNMLAMAALGHPMERMSGSLVFGFLNILFGITSAGLITIVSFIWYLLVADPTNPFTYPSMYLQGAIGYSGILFALLVLRTKIMPDGIMMLFGICPVRTWFYPWALLLLLSGMSMLMPNDPGVGNISFWGHFSGILVGYAYCHKLFDFCLPSLSTFTKIESSFCCRALESRPNCIPSQSATPLRGSDPTTCLTMCTGWFRALRGWRPIPQNPPADETTVDHPSDVELSISPPGRGRRIGTGIIDEATSQGDDENIDDSSTSQMKGIGDETSTPNLDKILKNSKLSNSNQ